MSKDTQFLINLLYLKFHSTSTQAVKTTPFWLEVERYTYCPDGKSVSFTTAQFVNDSSSVGHRAACIGYERERWENTSNKTIFFLYVSCLKASVSPQEIKSHESTVHCHCCDLLSIGFSKLFLSTQTTASKTSVWSATRNAGRDGEGTISLWPAIYSYICSCRMLFSESKPNYFLCQTQLCSQSNHLSVSTYC